MAKRIRLEWKCDCAYTLTVEAYPSRGNPGVFEPAVDKMICVCDKTYRVTVSKNEETRRQEIHVTPIVVMGKVP